jgi:hypothetical protein
MPPPPGMPTPGMPVPQNAPLPSGAQRSVVGKLYNSVRGFFGSGGRMTKRMMKKKAMMKKKTMMKKKKAMKKKTMMKKKMMKKKLKAKTRKSRR